MALTISKLKMWKDPKYTQGCIEVPPAGSWKLPSADYALAAGETLRPHKGSTLTSLELPLSFTKLFPMSYLYIEATDGNGTVKLFGWIDSVTQIATSAEAVRIDWSVDWWRSFSGSATFGSGIVTRCNDASLKRPNIKSPRYKTSSGYAYLYPHPTTADPQGTTKDTKLQLWPVIMATITETDTNDPDYTRTFIAKFWWPSGSSGLSQSNTVGTGMSVKQCYNGYVDEIMSALMTSWAAGTKVYNFEIIAAYCTPIAPDYRMDWDYPNSRWFSTGNASGSSVVTWDGTDWIIYYDLTGSTDSLQFGSFTFKINPGVTPDYFTEYIITDFDGNIAGTLPWGLTIYGFTAMNDIGVAGGYMHIISGWDAARSLTYPVEGRAFTIPLPVIPITSNYWSDYVLSGQREFNRLNREYAREEEAWKTGVSETKNAIDTAISIDPADWLTALVQSGTGFASIGANLMINEAYADKYNRLDDMASSRQKNTIQENGISAYWLQYGSGPTVMTMQPDSYSATEYTNEISLMGYEMQHPVTSCSSYITTGGPIQITQLVITGNIPPQAKRAIKTMLENGIRITENNPSGVAP